MKIYLNNIFKVKTKINKRKDEKEKLSKETRIEKELNYKKNDNSQDKIIYSMKKYNFKKNNNIKYINKNNLKNTDDNIIKIENIERKNTRAGAKNYLKKVKVKNEENANKNNLSKSYYVLLFFMILLAGVSVKLVFDEYNDVEQEDFAVFNNQEDLEVDIYSENLKNQNIQSSNLDTRKNVGNTEVSSSVSTKENIIQKVQNAVDNNISQEEYLVFSKPIEGEISKIFSDDKLIYSKTLEMWKTHDGIDVLADIGSSVYSIERGTVEKIYEDAFYGVTIVIDHGQGYKSSYSNLDINTYVKEGDSIKKGKKIGIIGNTAIGEIKDLEHLHFMLYENNEIVDPSSIFK
jgi:murein DD-endopeptidase MepM/ murein hydrolase activator NlpD